MYKKALFMVAVLGFMFFSSITHSSIFDYAKETLEPEAQQLISERVRTAEPIWQKCLQDAQWVAGDDPKGIEIVNFLKTRYFHTISPEISNPQKKVGILVLTKKDKNTLCEVLVGYINTDPLTLVISQHERTRLANGLSLLYQGLFVKDLKKSDGPLEVLALRVEGAELVFRRIESILGQRYRELLRKEMNNLRSGNSISESTITDLHNLYGQGNNVEKLFREEFFKLNVVFKLIDEDYWKPYRFQEKVSLLMQLENGENGEEN